MFERKKKTLSDLLDNSLRDAIRYGIDEQARIENASRIILVQIITSDCTDNRMRFSIKQLQELEAVRKSKVVEFFKR